jgi:hypothetical protein
MTYKRRPAPVAVRRYRMEHSEHDERLIIVQTVKHLLVLVLALTLLAACGEGTTDVGSTTDPQASTSSVAGTSDHDLALIAWCGDQTVDICAYSLWGIAGETAAESCLLDPQSCSEPPVTTIPDPNTTSSSTTLGPPPAGAVSPVDIRILDIVGAAHSGEAIDIAIVLETPSTVQDAEALAAELGLSPRLAWLTDYACIDMSGIDGWPPGMEAVREAPFDGPALVAERRQAASHTTVTGYHLFEAGLTRLLRAGEAMRAPGVMVAALSAKMLPEGVDDIARSPGVKAARVWQPGFTDLPDVPVPDCG